MKLKNVVGRTHMRTEQNSISPSTGGVSNLMSQALDNAVKLVEGQKQDKRLDRIDGMKAELKANKEYLKELEKAPSFEKRKQASEYFNTKIEESNGVKGIIRGLNQEVDLRKMDAERDDIYKFALEQGENEEDTLTKIIRSEEELLQVLDNSEYTDTEKEEMISRYKEKGKAKSPIYQGVWEQAKRGFTKEQLYSSVAMITENAQLFEIQETSEMMRMLVEAGVEGETISDAEASSILATIGDANLNKVMEDVRDSNLSDEEKNEQYKMVLGAIQERNPVFFTGLGYEPFSYGRAQTVFNNFQAKFENDVAVTRQEERKLAESKRTNYTEHWYAEGNKFNGDYRTTREFQFNYIQQNNPQLLTEYMNDPTGTMAELYVNNQIQGFKYMSDAETEGFARYMTDPNTPLDLRHSFQKDRAQLYLGRVPYDSIEYEMYHEEAYNLGGISPEMFKAQDMGEDKNAKIVSERIASGRLASEGAVAKLDAITLIEATKDSDLAPTVMLDTIDAMNLLSDEPGFGRMSKRFNEDFANLIVWHMTKTTSLSEDSLTADAKAEIYKITNGLFGSASPTDALLNGGLLTDKFLAVIESDDFSGDVDSLLNAYTSGKTIAIDESSKKPVVIDIEGIEQRDLNNTREFDFETRNLHFLDNETGEYIPVTEDMAKTMTIDSSNGRYSYQLEGGIAYEKIKNDYVPFGDDVSNFIKVREELPTKTERMFSALEEMMKDLGVNSNGTPVTTPPVKKQDGTITSFGVEFKKPTNRFEAKPMEQAEPVEERKEVKMFNFEEEHQALVEGQVQEQAQEPVDSTKAIPTFNEPRVNKLYGETFRHDAKVEGIRPTRYESPEAKKGSTKSRSVKSFQDTDTIGIGHKMSVAEHNGNYVMINGNKRNLDTPLTDTEIKQLHIQDYKKTYNKVDDKLIEHGGTIEMLSDQMLNVAMRLGFNLGNVSNNMAKGLVTNDIQKLNDSMLSSITAKDKSGNRSTYIGLAMDRAQTYNSYMDVPVKYAKITKTAKGSKVQLFSENGEELEVVYKNYPPLKGSKVGKVYDVDTRNVAKGVKF